MFLNTNMNNHCWSPRAQRVAAAYDEVDAVDAETEETTLEDEIEVELGDLLQDEDKPRQYCLDCLHCPCSDVKAAERKNGGRSLSVNELWDLATGCDGYLNRTKYMATVNSTKGGATP